MEFFQKLVPSNAILVTFRPTFPKCSSRTIFFLVSCYLCSLATFCSGQGQGCTPIYNGHSIEFSGHGLSTSKSTRPTSPYNVMIFEETSFNLTCVQSHLHKIQFQWRLERDNILNDTTFTIYELPDNTPSTGYYTTMLTARNATRNHTGMYKCIKSGCNDPGPNSNAGLYIRVIYAEKPLIDFQTTTPQKWKESDGEPPIYIVPAIVGEPANISCITNMVPGLETKWRKKSFGLQPKETKWQELDTCVEIFDEAAKKEELYWLKLKTEDKDTEKCFIFNVGLEDGSRNMTLFFTSVQEKDFGEYSCGMTDEPERYPKTDTIVRLGGEVNIAAFRKFKSGVKSLHAIEGEEAKIYCNLTWPGNDSVNGNGYKVRWSKDGQEIPQNNFTVNHTFTQIIIPNVTMLDRGMYKCKIVDKNEFDVSSFQYQVRIRSKVAILWPFIAICAEVLVICLIILIYEKTKTKAEIADSDTDGSPDQKNVSDNNDGASEVLRLQQKE